MPIGAAGGYERRRPMQPRQQWLLLFLGADGGTFEVDQVRAMKGLFLLSQEPNHPTAGLYRFDPYDYGPFDSRVYRDLDTLRLEGLATVKICPGSTKRVYRLTEEGRRRFEETKRQTSVEDFQAVARAKQRVTSL